MTDRELLEAAARAAGIDGVYESWAGQGFMEGIRRKGNPKEFKIWNPLIYDDQALRLAVKLGLDVQMHGCNSMHPYAFAFDDARNIGEEEQPSDGDPYAATRRAIVRAAAAIGSKQ